MRQEPGALEDLLVLEVGSGVAGGYCASILGQLGARVVKLDAARVTAPATTAGANRVAAERIFLDSGKDVVATEESGDLEEWATRADVVIWGVPSTSGDAGHELREQYEQLRSKNPRLVFVALTPFGSSGAFAGWHGRSLQAQAVTGWPAFVGEPAEAPLTSNYGGGELQHGLLASAATMAAVLHRDELGGDFVDVSLADTMAAGIRVYSHVYRLYGLPLRRAGLRAPGSSGRYPHRVFRCKDGSVSVICRMVAEWDRFIVMIGSPAWASEPRYRDFYAMATVYPDEVDALINPWMESHTKAELAALAIEHRVPMAPVRTVAEALEDVQLNDRDFFREVDNRDGGTIRVPGLPTRWRSA